VTFISSVPTIECLADETVLIQAWKKTTNYIRYHNWFSDTLELDRTAINLREFISGISSQIKSERPLLSEPIRMVPAPKSQQWRVGSDGQWKPDGKGNTAKIRPLAHVSLRDQVIATAMMMCLADRVETRQGDPAIPLGSAELNSVVSYGNRLFSVFKKGKADLRWGSGTLYRGFYEDYQTFLARPEDVAERIHQAHPRTLIVQSDLRQFYDHKLDSLDSTKEFSNPRSWFSKPLITSRFFQDQPAGGFRLDSPVKVPVASEMPRCAPPHTFGAGEEPCRGGLERRDWPYAPSSHRCCAAASRARRTACPQD